MRIQDILSSLEKLAPPSMQEDYDNCGLITGDQDWECKGAIICLDSTEEIIDEAIKSSANLVIAHHPIIFKGLKKINGKNYVERTIIKAIKKDIAIYAIHTNLDNVINGVNGKIADLLNLKNRKVIQQKEGQLRKLVCFAPVEMADKVRSAIFEAGAGAIGKYSECSFNTEGFGTFKPGEGADPFEGKQGERHEGKELKMEFIFPPHLERKIIAAMLDSHDYEEVAYDIMTLGNYLSDVGAGIIGELETPQDEQAFLTQISGIFQKNVIRHSKLLGKPIKKVAVCGGAGSFLSTPAQKAGADILITSDLKYHEFFDADGKMVLADIGHFESERFTIDLLFDHLRENFPNFAVQKTAQVTNPVNYFRP